jgi:hypothetical protein
MVKIARHSKLGKAWHATRKLALSVCPPADTVWQVNGSALTIKTSSSHGGSVYSLVWGGLEYINASDLGRELQTAYQLDGGGEGNNPTEAGSSKGTPSKVLGATVSGKVLSTSVSPAYWVPFNGQTYSADQIDKRIEVDYHGVVNLVRHDVTVTLAAAHATAGVEGLTGYVALGLNKLYAWDNGSLTVLPYTPSAPYDPSKIVSSFKPLVLADASLAHAIGVYSPTGGYNAWMGAGGNSNKWDANVFGAAPIAAGRHSWVVYYVVGTLADVTTKLGQVIANP